VLNPANVVTASATEQNPLSSKQEKATFKNSVLQFDNMEIMASIA
jgi:hypothetical protein